MSIDNLSSKITEEESRAEWQQYLDTLPKVPGGNGKKECVVGCYTPDDWEHIHKVLMEDGTLEDNIPKDGIQCSNSKNHSETRGTYVLDDAEVESLRKHPKVKFVNIDISVNVKSIKKYFQNVDWVFHLAGLADIVPSIKEPKKYFVFLLITYP